MRLIDADEIIAWAEGSISAVSPCEDQRDAGYLDCLKAVIEIIKEEPVIEAVPLDALCEFLARYCLPPKAGEKFGTPNNTKDAIKEDWKFFLRSMFTENDGTTMSCNNEKSERKGH